MTCTHHWKIASPNGATVRGVCKNCGEARDFPTSSEAGAWYSDEGKARREQAAGITTPKPTETTRAIWR